MANKIYKEQMMFDGLSKDEFIFRLKEFEWILEEICYSSTRCMMENEGKCWYQKNTNEKKWDHYFRFPGTDDIILCPECINKKENSIITNQIIEWFIDELNFQEQKVFCGRHIIIDINKVGFF